MTVAIARLCASDEGFKQTLDKLIAWDMVSDSAVEETVRTILAEVREQGDRALVELTNRFDRRQVESIDQLCISSDQFSKHCSLSTVNPGRRWKQQQQNS